MDLHRTKFDDLSPVRLYKGSNLYSRFEIQQFQAIYRTYTVALHLIFVMKTSHLQSRTVLFNIIDFVSYCTESHIIVIGPSLDDNDGFRCFCKRVTHSISPISDLSGFQLSTHHIPHANEIRNCISIDTV